MALVELSIGGRSYKISCENGEEQNLLELSKYVDNKTKELTSAIGHISEPLLLVMTCLQIADEFSETYRKIEASRVEKEKEKEIEKEIEPAPKEETIVNNSLGINIIETIDKKVAAQLNNLAEKIYSIAQNL